MTSKLSRLVLAAVVVLVAGGCSWPLVVLAPTRPSDPETCDQSSGRASTVKVYLTENASAAQVDRVTRVVRGVDGVVSARYVGKAEALERAKKLFADSPGVMANLPGNPFPASLSVEVDSTDALTRVGDAVDGAPGVDSVGGVATRSAQVACGG